MAELYAEKEKELAKLQALQASEDRNRRSLSPARERAKSPSDGRSPDPKKLKKDENGGGVMLNGLRRTPPKENGLELGLNNNNNNGHHKKEAVSPGAYSASSSHSNSSTPAPVPGPKKSSDEPQVKPA